MVELPSNIQELDIDASDISVELVNQLQISKPEIVEKLIFNEKLYEVKYLQLLVVDYVFKFQFDVYFVKILLDIILGWAWMEALDALALNLKKKYLTFFYNKKKTTLWGLTMKSCTKCPLLKDIKCVIDVILQND